jgi:outer membrane lipoprotein carrier protein
MFDIIGILTRVLISTAPAPQPAHAPQQIVTSIPLMAAPGANLTASQIVDKVQGFYAEIKQVTASFRQAVTNDTFGSTKTSDGTVWIMKPGKMRWDYLEQKQKQGKVSRKKSFISNGSMLYVVEYDNMQIVKKNLQQDLMPVAVSFLYGKGDLKTEFNAEMDATGKYGAKGEYVLKMTPKKPSAQYKNLYLVVSPDDFRVTQSVIIDSSNNSNHFRFYSPDFKKPIEAKWFEFDEKGPEVKNYRIVDADQQGAGSGSATTQTPKK